MELKGATALVTGGAGGLGAGAVRRLAAAGMNVVIADMAAEAGEQLAAEVGDGARFVRTDVLEDDDLTRAIEVAGSMGPLRLSVAAHGGPVAQSRILDRENMPYSLETFRRTTDVYLNGTFNVLRLAASAMARTEPLDSNQRGLIVNTASIAAFEGQIGQSDYAAAKGGVVGLGLAAARDLAPLGIRVMTIAPGTFFTPAFRMEQEAAEAKWGQTVPNPRRMGRPDEYGQLIVSFAVNDYLNGEVVRIDGAQRLGPRS